MENQNQSIWSQFDTDKVHFQDLGRSAIFLIPENKLALNIGGEKVEQHLWNFLVTNFGAFTFSVVSNYGVWIGGRAIVYADVSRLYDVSFTGKERISILGEKLAEIAKVVGEECIYFKAGQYTALVYPKP